MCGSSACVNRICTRVMYLIVKMYIHSTNGMVIGPLELSNSTGGSDASLTPSIASSLSKYGQPEQPVPVF